MNNNPVISVKNVTKAVEDRQLLVDVTFDVVEQSLVSLIGPNGAGKSTLVKIMLGLDTAYEGEVVIRRGERVQYIPQLASNDQYQLPVSVYEYLCIGATWLYSGQKKKIDFEHALTHVGVAAEKLRQPFTSLSGGERQRVAIARALLSSPTVLILDEPLAAVDHASRDGLYELIRHLQKDHAMTVFLVSHDVESVMPLSDHVLCLNKTLHTNCYPSAFIDAGGARHAAMHHHCE